MRDVRTLLNGRQAGVNLRAWAGLWMISTLFLHQPDAMAQPPPDAEASEQPSPETQGDEPPSLTPPAPEPTASEQPPLPGGLEELLQEDVPTVSVGSFGYRLRRYGISPYVHGVLAVDLWRWRQRADGKPSYSGFDLRDAHLYFGADILDIIVPELFLEFESNEPGMSELFLRYAQLDLRIHKELVVMRSGLFLVPFGAYNTEAFPRFITRLPDRPGYFNEITPVAWRELGVQLFGRWEWKPGLALSYAVYVTNGMQQPVSDDGVGEGGSLEELQSVFEEVSNSTKSIGGHLRVEPIPGLTLGLSGYTGAYTANGARKLSMVGMNLGFYRGGFSLEAETALARQEVTGGALMKWGYVAIAAYRVHPMLEPVIGIDEVRLDAAPKDDSRTYWAGFNFFPFPEYVPTALLKTAYGGTVHGDGASGHRLTVQLVVGY